ncbi:tetraspanin-8-like [Mercurialis annua]|uniref:tetraspanin-8-like n=1 Tax=Mercurialis annua TaxID=3986 RepID=UPI0021603F15|nr:tetraspanin-8-like [Mercurialis annua]
MTRASNIVLGVFNAIILILGLVAIAMGLYFFLGSNSQCEKGIQNEMLIIGAALFIVALIGLIGSCFGINFFLILYLVVMFLLILGLICFTIFTIFVTNEAAGRAASRTKIMNFNTWIRDRFVNGKNWNPIRTCLIDANVCKSLGNVGVDPNVSNFYKKHLSPIQSGCCKPPIECGFEHENATFWVKPKEGSGVRNSDCRTWSNEQKSLCYNCESCKSGVVDNVRNKWKIMAIANAIFTVILILLYSVGCCARKTSSSSASYTKYTGYRSYA